MTIDLPILKALATAAAANSSDTSTLSDYCTAVPPATVLNLIAEVERHRLVNAEGCKPESSIMPDMPCAGFGVRRDLNPAEGGRPDIRNSHTAALAVLEERLRQIESKGYTAELDDGYTRGQLADAAGAYAFWAYTCNMDYYKVTTVPPSWPWTPDHWKPTNQRQMLVRAGALILAEIARVDRKDRREVIA